MPTIVYDVVSDFARDMKKLFKQDLSRVVVYGSYARGDYGENSDVDVMILVKTPENNIPDYRDRVSDCAFEYFMNRGYDISPVIKNENQFNYWVDSLPYYQNILREGIDVNA